MTEELFEELKPKGFIEDLVEAMTSDIEDLDPNWAWACAESLLSAFCFNQYAHTQIGDLPLTIWNFGIGPSGDYKSAPIKYFVYEIVESVEDLTGQRFLISKFSPEGFVQFVCRHEEEIFNRETGKYETKIVEWNKGLIARDEFTQLVSGVKNKRWMAGINEDLCEVYDGKIPPRYTVAHGYQRQPNVRFAFLAATTPYIYRLWDENFFVQGLGNRFDYCLVKARKPKPKGEDFFSREHRNQREELIEESAKKLAKLIESPVRLLGLMPEASELWRKYEYEKNCLKHSLKETDLRRSYVSRLPDKALRRAAIYFISSHIDTIWKARSTELVIDEASMELAITRQNKLYEYFEALLREWPKWRKKKAPDIQTMESERELILNIVREHKLPGFEKGIASLKLLVKESGLSKAQIAGIVSDLVTSGQLKVIEGDESRRLIFRMTTAQRKEFLVETPRGNPPYFYAYIGED